MINRFKQFFEDHLMPAQVPAQDTHEIHLAAAALLVEIARADSTIDEHEQRAIIDSLHRAFDLPEAELADTAAIAVEATDEAEDFFQFTRLVNDHYRASE